jgi:ABC-2 type transport system ATP-binding protein
MSNALLQVSKLSKSFGSRRAVDQVSFQVAAGQTLGLIGPNGAGKSTTVGMIAGLLSPDSGQVTVKGHIVTKGNSAAKHAIGLVPQELALYEDLSAQANLSLFGGLYGLSGAHLKARCDAVLDLVQLRDRARDLPSTFSGGMKRRLNIAAALLHEPQLLILDEPTVGVDPQSRNAIFDCLEALRAKGHALIYTSHYMEEVERLADHVIIIDHGKVIADASPADLHRSLPAQAALQLDFLQAPDGIIVAGLSKLDGVTRVDADGSSLNVSLHSIEQGLPLLNWLTQQGCVPQHYASAKTKLEDVFLTLTGRSLRD